MMMIMKGPAAGQRLCTSQLCLHSISSQHLGQANGMCDVTHAPGSQSRVLPVPNHTQEIMNQAMIKDPPARREQAGPGMSMSEDRVHSSMIRYVTGRGSHHVGPLGEDSPV